jgi:hypothetical protein
MSQGKCQSIDSLGDDYFDNYDVAVLISWIELPFYLQIEYYMEVVIWNYQKLLKK